MKDRPDVPIKNEALLRQALRHRSATDSVCDSYERLEFFGDSVLGMIIAQYLYEQHPDWDQGTLSKAKATVVQEAPLAQAAKRLQLEKYIEVSPAEGPWGKERPSILSDVFEALVGALYIDQGLAATRWFVLEHLHDVLEQVARGDIATTDYKSRLQEITQARWKTTPVYQLVREDGEAHEKWFEVVVMVENEVMGSGKGRSKKEAEQLAAREALELIARAEAVRAYRTDE